MVTADAPETVTTLPETDSTAATPSSEAPQGLVSPETPVPPAQGEETPAPAETPQSEVKPLDQWSLDDLNAKAYKDGLSPDETKRRDQLQQADSDRRAYQAQQNRILQQEMQQRASALEAKQQKVKADLLALDERERNYGGDPELYAQQKASLIDSLVAEAAPLELERHRVQIGEVVLKMVGDNLQNRQIVNSKDLPELVSDLYRLAHAAGQKAGVPEGTIAKSQKDWDTELKAAQTKAVDDFKAANPQFAPPSTTGVVGALSTNLTLAQIDAMPTSEWLAMGDQPTRQRILNEARERAARS